TKVILRRRKAVRLATYDRVWNPAVASARMGPLFRKATVANTFFIVTVRVDPCPLFFEQWRCRAP
ncbi:MAG TPA: hypothetical protein VFK31_07150, partial [Rhodanobacteraceae bacterium]|nr:hypothetical protein [Rhodanobacteraceae bacterium]